MLDLTDKKYFSWKITERFLFIMDRILGNRANGKVTAKMFGDVVGIASSNLNRIRQNPTENFVTIEAVGRLCDNYKISPAWLILNIGNPYADEHLYNAYQALEVRLTKVEDVIKMIEETSSVTTKTKPKK